MDRLLEIDIRETRVRLNEEGSIKFLDFIYPDRRILPDAVTLDNVLDDLVSQGLYTKESSGRRKPGRWTGYAAIKKLESHSKDREARVAKLFNDVRIAMYKAYHIACFEWDAQPATKPLDGAYAVRKPGVTCYFQAPEGVSKRDWQHVVTFCEVKTRANLQRDKESFLETARKASCLISAQDGRHSVSCIRLLDSFIDLTVFHRSAGSISTWAFDINKSPLPFLRIIIGVSLSNYCTIGFDSSIKWQISGQTQKPEMLPEDVDMDFSDEALPDPEYFQSPESESADRKSLESDDLDDQMSPPDSDNLLHLKPASERFHSSESGDGHTNSSKRNDAPSPAHQEGKDAKWLEVTDTDGKRCKIWLKSILALSDSFIGQGTTVWEGEMDDEDGDEQRVAVKDSWIDPLRKYTEGMILNILEEHQVEGLPTLVSEEQVKTWLWTSDPHQLVNSSSHFFLSVLPPGSPLRLRILSRLVIRPVGRLVLEFTSLGELLVAFLDYIVVHKHALEDAGVLHRDVNPSNLFFGPGKGRTDHRDHMDVLPDKIRERLCERIRNLSRRGVLGDWGYASPKLLSPASTPSSSPTVNPCHSDGPPMSPVDAESFSSIAYDNCVLVRKVGSPRDEAPTLLPVSKLTEEHDIVVLTGTDDPTQDPRRTIDLCPLYRTGTRSWMSAQLVMAGPGQPVTHNALHDLESFFYVLVGICVLFDQPLQQKSEEELAECYDKFFNTSEQSILKMITIQSDLTWNPYVVKHIHPYFKSLISLLRKLRSEIILPLASNDHGEIIRKKSCNHDTFIKHIVVTLSELQPDDWIDIPVKRDDASPKASCEVIAR